MAKKTLLVLVVLLAFLGPRIYHLVYRLDYHKSYYNHLPGPCRTLKGIEFGSEDMELLPDNTVLITSGLLLFGQMLAEPKEGWKGRVYSYDFNQPENDPVEVDLQQLPRREEFNPHGMSTWVENGEIFVYIISHSSEFSVVESFVYKENKLFYQQTFGSDSFKLLNDLVAVGKDKFYFTNFQHYRSSANELLAGFYWGTVGYFDGSDGEIILSNLLHPNGINASPDRKYIYVAEAGGLHGIYTYERNKNNTLTQIASKPLSTYVDNINVDKETGDLWLGCHYVLYRLVEYAEDTEKNSSPSQVLRLRMESGHVTDVTEVLMDDGKVFSASSGALYRNNVLLVGSVHTKALMCDVKYI